METVSASAAPRRLIVRLIPWTLAMGVFAGGGYGVYRFAVPSTIAHGAPAVLEETNASEQIKQLFAAAPAPASSDAYSPTPSNYPSSSSNRYAASPSPQSPPAAPAEADEAATPRSAAELTGVHNPFAAAEQAAVSAAASASPAAADVQATVEPATVEQLAAASAAAEAFAADGAEVARGQEPMGENPLRSAASRNQEAQVAFNESQEAFVGAPAPMPAADESQGAPPATNNPFAPANRYSEAAGSAAAENAAAAFADNASTTALPAPAPPQRGFKQSSALATAPASAETIIVTPAAAPPAPSSVGDASAPAGGLPAPDAEQPSIVPTPGLAAADGSGRPGERSLEGLQSPTLSIQKLAPAEIQVGKLCTFAVRVHNTSPRTVHDVQIQDEVPLGTQLTGTAPKAQVVGSRVTWNLGTLAAGEERVVEMELMPTEEGELGSVAAVTFAAQASAKVRCTKPELALRLATPPRVMIGERQVVEIEISNPGSGDATGVMLLENIPAGVSHEAGPALEFEIGTLRAGETRRLDLVLTAEQAGRISNVLTARADANLEVQAACEFEVIAPQLQVSIEGPGMRYLDRPATYTVNIQNPGTAAAKDVELITQLPKGLQFKSANNLGEYDPTTHSVHWSLAELPANETGTVQLTALPVETGQFKLLAASRASQGLEDQAEARVAVEGLVALSYEVAAVDGAIEVGGETSYEITVVNQGSKPATNVQVQVALAPGLRVTGGDGVTRHVIEGDRIVFAPMPQLAPREEAKFRVQVQGLRPGDQRAKVMITADEAPEPITKEQSTRVYADQ